MKKKAISLGLGLGLLGIGLIGGVCKSYKENSMQVQYFVEDCIDKLDQSTRIEMKEVPLSWGKRYNVIVDNNRIGTVYEDVFNWGKRFDFYAGTKEKGKHLGYAQEKILSFGHQSTVYDSSGNKIGRLDEVVLSFNPGHLIEIYDFNNTKVATSDERGMSLVHTTDIIDNEKRTIGGTVKSVFWDDYTITLNNNDIDKRLILSLVAMEDKLDDERDSKDKESK
ncbi:MAG: hypothetical protein Q7S27_00610 [Nanoarchaeota archaeon]|nr:hypothetical protein [Nanoarchaeota archaeon]